MKKLKKKEAICFLKKSKKYFFDDVTVFFSPKTIFNFKTKRIIWVWFKKKTRISKLETCKKKQLKRLFRESFHFLANYYILIFLFQDNIIETSKLKDIIINIKKKLEKDKQC